MENEKDKWIDELMTSASARHLQRKPDNKVYSKILSELEIPVKNNAISFNQFRLIGIAAAVLIIMNISTLAFRFIKDERFVARSAYGLESYDLNIYK